MPPLIEDGRAKVNLTLRVVGRRVDGYHDIESVVAFADCADRLTLTPGPELSLKMTGPLAKACGEAADNLVLRAAQLLGESIPGLKAASFELEKGGSVEVWVEALAAGANDLEVPATQIQPLIGEVIAALNGTNGAWLARMSGSGATCFAIYENTAEAQRAANKIQLDHPSWWVHAGVLS